MAGSQKGIKLSDVLTLDTQKGRSLTPLRAFSLLQSDTVCDFLSSNSVQ